jgi:uncharacterized membrane protein
MRRYYDRRVETARLETFSDGVFAIAATLLILEIRPPAHGGLTSELLHLWPSYLAYAISFATIGIMWINHHALFKQIGHVDRTFLTINVVFLLVIAFIPFPTEVLARNLHGEARAAAIFYGLVNVLMATMFSAVWFYASVGRRLIAEDADPRVVSGISRSFAPGIPSYVVATLTAYISPWLAVSLFGALAIFYALESSLFARSTG